MLLPSSCDLTGKERDAESGLDVFGARYYGSSLGRFMTPDWGATPMPVPYADMTDPQKLDLYGYVRLRLIIAARPITPGPSNTSEELDAAQWLKIRNRKYCQWAGRKKFFERERESDPGPHH